MDRHVFYGFLYIPYYSNVDVYFCVATHMV